MKNLPRPSILKGCATVILKDYIVLSFALTLSFFLILQNVSAQPTGSPQDPELKLFGMTQNNIFSMHLDGSSFNDFHPFMGTGTIPKSTPIEGSDGKLYAMTNWGGIYDLGVIFSVEKDGTNYSVLQNFNEANGSGPSGDLMEGSNGKLFGMTSQGGSEGFGVIFSIAKDGTGYTILRNLDNVTGSYPWGSLMKGSDGKLYGMTQSGGSASLGVIFSIEEDGTSYTVLQNFDETKGTGPSGTLMEGSDGKLYGLTSYGGSFGYGVVFSIQKNGAAYTVLQDFDGSNGASPRGALVEGSDGRLYGMTNAGGSFDSGVAFSITNNGADFTVIHNFTFSDGYPNGNLIEDDGGKLYGMTNNGGTNGEGALFSMSRDGLDYSILVNFGGTNGAGPGASLMEGTDGRLYGLTPDGGNYRFGVLFSVNKNGTDYSVLQHFNNLNGQFPSASLILGDDGKVYGMTQAGGVHGRGVIFSSNLDGSGYTVLQNFNEANGVNVQGDLLEASDGKLYGMAAGGGTGQGGVVFSLTKDGTGYSILHHFQTSTGRIPFGNLIECTDGKLYGMTSSGGSNAGVIFSMTKDGSTYTVLRNFTTSTGGSPHGSLIEASDGRLYGMTTTGGTSTGGTIFSIAKDGTAYTVLQNFTPSTGINPYGNLVEASNGNLYGTLYLGNGGKGAIFSIAKDGTNFANTKFFQGSDGANPRGSLIEGPGGKLYGMTQGGGSHGAGVVFSLSTDGSNQYTVLRSFNKIDGLNPLGSLLLVSPVQQPQTLTFSPLAPKTYGAPFALTASSSSGLPVTYVSSNPLVATITGNTVTMVGVGTTTITASQPGNPYYLPAEDVAQTLTVTKATLTATADNKTIDYQISYYSGPPPLTISYTGFVGGDNAAVLNFTPVAVTSAGYSSGPGSYPVNVMGGFDDNYNIVPVSGTLTITPPINNSLVFNGVNQEAQLGNWFNLQEFTISMWVKPGATQVTHADIIDNNHTNTRSWVVQQNGALTNQYIFGGGFSASALSFSLAANVWQHLTIVCTPYFKGVYVDGSLVDSRSSVFGISMPYDGTQFLRLGNWGGGGRNWNGQMDNVKIYTRSLSQVEIQNSMCVQFNQTPYAYPYAYYAMNEQGGSTLKDNLNLHPGTLINNPVFTPSPVCNIYPQMITFNPLPSKTYGDPSFGLTATSTSGQLISYASSSPSVASISGSTITIRGAGQTTITASQSGNQNYYPAPPITQALVVNQAPLNATADDKTRMAGETNPPFTITFSGFKNSDTQADIDAWPQAYTLANVDSPPGAYPIILANGIDDNYQITLVNGTLTLTPKPIDQTPRLFGMTQNSIFSIKPNGSEFQNYNLIGGTGEAPQYAAPIEGSDGKIYGTATSGGNHGYGVVFSMAKDGSGYTALHHFNKTNGGSPLGGLVEGSDGRLYGMTYQGGTSNYGVLFTISKDGTGYSVLLNFNYSNGRNPSGSLIEGSDGKLYGMTEYGGSADEGVVFSIAKDGTGYSLLKTFNYYVTYSSGRSPKGSLIEGTDGKLYGLTRGGGTSNYGTAFSLAKDGTSFTILHSFDGLDGMIPNGNLTESNDGRLYGMTENGGTSGNGVVFSVAKDGTDFTVLQNFNNSNGGNPYGSLTKGSDGKLYGMTQFGGNSGGGVLFSIGASGSGFTILQHFAGLAGNTPRGSVLEGSDGLIYGMASYGGPSNAGTIFSIAKNGSNFNVLHNFGSLNGSKPQASLIRGSNERLYGMTLAGGIAGDGTIFSFAQDGTGYTVLHSFINSIGRAPSGSLTEASNGKLYGMTQYGGSSNGGILFSIDKDGTGFTALYNFNSSTGAIPQGSLIESSDGRLYGMTSSGGNPGVGVIFSIAKDGTGYAVIKNFAFSDGRAPSGSLTECSDGKLYGMAAVGGSSGNGVVFSLAKDGTGYSVLLNFNNSNGGTPRGNLIEGSDGRLYGMTQTGGSGYGVIFSIAKDGTGYSLLRNFSNFYGAPQGSLIQGFDGKLYGMTAGGDGYGSIFSIAKDGTNFVTLRNFNGSDGQYPAYGSLLLLGEPTQEAQNISFDPLAVKTYGDPTFTLNATASSGLAASYTSSNPTVATVTGNTVTIHNAGETIITASQEGNESYFPAENVVQTLSVSKALLTAQADNKTSIYGDDLVPLTITYTGFVNGDNLSSLDAVPQASVLVEQPAPIIGVPADQFTRAGTHPIRLSILGQDNNYNFNFINGEYGVTKSPLTLTAESKTRVYGVANPALTFAYAGFKGTEGQTYLDNLPTLSTTANITSVPGAYPIEATGGSDNNYEYTLVNGTLSITGTVPNVYLTTPADGATGQNVKLVLTARAVTGAANYTIQISTTPDFSSGLKTKTGARTRTFDTLQYNTTYYAHVRTNLNPAYGKVTTFSTLGPEVFSYITSPANNATGVKLNVSVTANAVPQATVYTIELNPDPDFNPSTAVVLSGGRTLAFNGLRSNTTYYARVRTNMGIVWGATRTFTTLNAASYAYVTKPAPDAVDQNVSLNITSNAVPNATTYTIQLSETEDFAVIAVERTGNNRTLAFAGLRYNTTYYSRVRTNLTEEFGEVRRFFTRDGAALAYITSPANGATGVRTTVNIMSNSVPGATLYTIELNTRADFTGTSIVRSLNQRTINFPGLASGTTYYGRVSTNNMVPGMWGSSRSFTTAGSPAARMSAPETEITEVQREAFSVHVSPNPFQEKFSVYVETPQQQAVTLELSDLAGRAIHHSEAVTNTLIEIKEPMTNGVYLLKVRTGSNIKVVRVIRAD